MAWTKNGLKRHARTLSGDATGLLSYGGRGGEEEEEKEEEELYSQLETRVQTNEAKSKNRRASQT